MLNSYQADLANKSPNGLLVALFELALVCESKVVSLHFNQVIFIAFIEKSFLLSLVI